MAICVLTIFGEFLGPGLFSLTCRLNVTIIDQPGHVSRNYKSKTQYYSFTYCKCYNNFSRYFIMTYISAFVIWGIVVDGILRVMILSSTKKSKNIFPAISS